MSKKKKQKNMKFRILLCLGFAILFASVFLFEPQIFNLVNKTNRNTYQNVIASDLIVHFIDVGQGDSIAIELPDDKVVLIDSGTGSSKTSLISYLNANVLVDDKNIDYFIVTHPHEDHIGGGAAVFQNFDILSFYRPTVYTQNEKNELSLEYGESYANGLHVYNTVIFQQLVSAAKEEECETVFFSSAYLPTIVSEEYTLTFLTPQNSLYDNLNNYSPMILLEYQNKKVLFTGDAETQIENEYLGLGLFDKIDVLKVGHHGSSTSSSQLFLNRIQPTYSIISVGKDNTYGHPNENILTRFASMQSQVYRTDENGTILLGISSAGLFVHGLNSNGLPINIQVWEIYVAGCVIVCYLVLSVNVTLNKPKTKKKASK